MKVNVSIEDNKLVFSKNNDREVFSNILVKLKKESYCAEHFIDMAYQYIEGILSKERQYWEFSKEDVRSKLLIIHNNL